MNFYGVLVVVCVLGFASVAFARYEYRHPAAGAATIEPKVGTVWYAALGINACGVQQPALTANPTSPGQFRAIANGAIQVAPTTAAYAGNNATFDKFVSSYIGLKITPTVLAVPGPRGLANPKTTWTSGKPCPSGTPDAGKIGHTLIAYWPTIGAKTPSAVAFSNQLKFSQNMLITLFYGPTGVTPPKPPQSAIDAMLNAPTTQTTTTLPPVTTTTHASTTTTTTKH